MMEPTLITIAVIQAIFLVLKLAKVVSWSWLWITAPLWITTGLTLFVLVAPGTIKKQVIK